MAEQNQTYDPVTNTYSQGPGAQAARGRYPSGNAPAATARPAPGEDGYRDLEKDPVPRDGGVTAGQQLSIDKSAARDEIMGLLDSIETVKKALVRLMDRMSQLPS